MRRIRILGRKFRGIQEGDPKWEDWTFYEIEDGEIVRGAVEMDEF